jgi:hypothetical protein
VFEGFIFRIKTDGLEIPPSPMFDQDEAIEKPLKSEQESRERQYSNDSENNRRGLIKNLKKQYKITLIFL